MEKLGTEAGNYDTFMEAGGRIIEELRSVVHGEIHPRDVDQRDMRQWLRIAWEALPSARVAAAMAAAQAAEYDDTEEAVVGSERDEGAARTDEVEWTAEDEAGAEIIREAVARETAAKSGASPTSTPEPSSRLGRYLQSTGGGEWDTYSALVARLEEMLRATGVPWSRLPGSEAAWTLSPDVGEVIVSLSEEGRLLTLYQPIHKLQPDADKTDYLLALLSQNFNSEGGACFAVRVDEDGSNHIVVLCRLPAASLDQEILEVALEHFFHLSSLFDDDSTDAEAS